MRNNQDIRGLPPIVASLLLSTLILGALHSGSTNSRARLFWLIWWGGVCASVLLVHQHHVIDVIAGTALGAVLLRNFRAAIAA